MGFARDNQRRQCCVRTRRRSSAVILAATLLTLSACSLFKRNYDCSEEPQPSGPSCRCREAAQDQAVTRCKRKYDCCVEYVVSSWMVDAPGGAYCTCWMLKPGQTCKVTATAYDGPNSDITGRPASCSPSE